MTYGWDGPPEGAGRWARFWARLNAFDKLFYPGPLRWFRIPLTVLVALVVLWALLKAVWNLTFG